MIRAPWKRISVVVRDHWTVLVEHQRVERLAKLLDDPSPTRQARVWMDQDPELARSSRIGQVLPHTRATDPPDPGFEVGLRAMLMATIDREGVGAAQRPQLRAVSRRPPVSHRRGRLSRVDKRVWVGLGTAGLVVVLSGISQASDASKPGDSLYSVKRSAESAKLAMAKSDEDRGSLLLEFARQRLKEATLSRDPTGIAALVKEVNVDTRRGVRYLTGAALVTKNVRPLDLIDEFADAQRIGLRTVEHNLEPRYQNVTDPAVAVLDAVTDRTGHLRPLVKCGTSAVIGVDDYGPVASAASCQLGGQRQPDPGGSSTHPGTSTAPGRSTPPTAAVTPAVPDPTVEGGTGGSMAPSSSSPASSGPPPGLLDGLIGLLPLD